MSDELARVLAEHPWRPNWWRCGRTCDWVPTGDLYVNEQHTEHLADVTLTWFAARPSVPAVTTEAVRGALINVLMNTSNYPPSAQRHMVGRDNGVLLNRATEAVMDRLAGLGIAVTR